ncbi:DUF4125 family protein [Paradesulfitobacterium aromaticivorans]
MRKEALIAKIIDLEWNMFHKVSNIGGKASCQENPETFKIMRYSQAISWAEDALESYLTDLSEAQENKRNLLTEKYARMMKSTSPWEYYDRIEHQLPALEPETLQLIDNIVKIVLEWEEELSAKYPNLVERGRPIHSTEDSQFVTSIETYLRGELATYSLTTLELYYKNVLKQKSENINSSEITLNSMVKQYGFNSLEEANEKIKTKINS